MSARDELPPVGRETDGYVLRLSDDEAAMVCRLVGELRDMISEPEPSTETTALVARLFPVAHHDDPEAEAEYQRLMRDELIESRRSACELVERVLSPDAPSVLSEPDLIAFMQSINSVRLVLGTMLSVSDNPDDPEVMPGFENSREYHLYGYLSWLLEWTVNALSDTVS